MLHILKGSLQHFKGLLEAIVFDIALLGSFHVANAFYPCGVMPWPIPIKSDS